MREKRGLAEIPLDPHLMSALEAGLPECAGIALGVDRLLMCLQGVDDIRDVAMFSL